MIPSRAIPLFICLLAMVFASCKLPLNIITDKELEKHYRNKKTRPQYQYLNYKNYHIHHAVVGDSTKPLLLFIHGAPGAWYSSMKMLDDPEMQANFRMVSVDRVGFGKSNNGLSVPSIDMHVRYLEKIVAEYNQSGQKVYLFGSSYGAPIAASFAMQNTSLVEELFLLSPVIDPATEEIFWFSYAAKIGPIAWSLPQGLNVTNDEKFAHRRELRRLKPFWKDITCKTIVVMGEKDWIAHKSNFTYAQKMLVNAREAHFYMLEKTGHVIMYQRPDLVKSLLLDKPIIVQETATVK